MIETRQPIDAGAMTAVVEYLAKRSNVCAKVIGRDGAIVAINKRGLELLEKEAQDVCGKVWTSFWDGVEREKASTALDSAFAGEPASFFGHFPENSGVSMWEVEIFPLDAADGAVTRVIALSTRIVEPGVARSTEARAVNNALSDVMHTLANLTAVSVGASNILRRGVDNDRAAELAQALDEAGRRASAAMQELREIFETGEQAVKTA